MVKVKRNAPLVVKQRKGLFRSQPARSRIFCATHGRLRWARSALDRALYRVAPDGLSRLTVGRAMHTLVDQGVLIHRQGKGTFLAPPKPRTTCEIDRLGLLHGDLPGLEGKCFRRANSQLFGKPVRQRLQHL
jgi:hypothetical protein